MVVNLNGIKFILRDLDNSVVEAWKENIDFLNFDISYGDVFHAGNASAIISPANSFGVMDGGIDLAYTRFFGEDLPRRLQRKIKDEYFEELPVGQATIVPTGNLFIKHLISAPTMRVPQIVAGTANAYLAFRAALIEIIKFNQTNPDDPIKSVICPGLATATGALPPTLCALQMKKAYLSLTEPKLLEWDQLLFDHYNMIRK